MKKEDKLNIKRKIFKDAMNHCIKFFNMEDCEFTLIEIEDSSIRGRCNYWNMNTTPYSDPRTFTINYDKSWLEDKDTHSEEIKKVAMHEVLEAWLSKLRDYSMNNSYIVTEREVDGEIHKVIRLFENKLTDKIFGEIIDELQI